MSLNKLSRRSFLFGMSAIGVAALAGVVSWRTSKETDIVVAILNNRLGKLNIKDGAFEKYSIDYIDYRVNYKKQLKLLGTFSGIFSIITPYSLVPIGHPLRRLEDNIVSNFLLSSDFFQNGSDYKKQVNYLGFYSPYKAPCRNFFNV